jgi:two-component system sensor histidine kinase RegB
VSSVFLRWLVWLRLSAAVAGIVLILSINALGYLSGSPWLLVGLLALVAVSNAPLARATIQLERWLVALLVLDVVVLTGIVELSGGPMNPFTLLYLIHVAVAAVTLGPRGAWFIALFAALAYGALFRPWETQPMAHDHGDMHGDMQLHLAGMWVAFVVTAAFITFFVQRIRADLAAWEGDRARVRELSLQRDKLTALATLAGGAAHELNTPLSTIAVAARELERALEDNADLVQDARLIRTEVDRCRDVLLDLSGDSGQAAGEPRARVEAHALAERAVPEKHRGRVVLKLEADGAELAVPERAVTRALGNLIKNALDASPAGEDVTLRVKAGQGEVRFEVVDHGAGMDDDVRARCAEPFFTTKPAGAGMGLGLFLAGAVAESLEGDLELESAPGRGTTATLRLPREAA